LIVIDIRKADKLSSEYGMFISSPYNEKVLEAVRTISPRHWHGEQREWELPVNKLSTFINELSDFEIQIIGDFSALEEKKLPKIDFKFKTKPFEHQVEGFNYGLTHDKWLLGDEQGCGKTWQVINIALAKRQLCEYKHCLIVCGVNGLKYNWFNEIAKHSDEHGHILGWRQRKDGKGMLKNISNANKLADIQRIDELPYFIITNVESLRDEKIANELKVLCSDGTIGMVAIDEIHRCKDSSSQQGKGILKLNAKDMIAMTGTPLLNTPLDLYIILKWLGYESHSFYAFKNHYAIMGGYGNYQIIGYQNKDELKVILSEMMLRRLKEDVLDLPEKLYIEEYVEMGKEQWGIYDEILADLRLNVDKIAETPNPLAQLIRLRQATGYTGILSSEIAISAKLDRMEELVEDAVANGRKVIVYSNWTDITDVVLERLKRYNPATITGKVNSSDVPLMEKKFQEDDSCKVIVGTISKMGTGYTLNSGTVEIFIDLPWTMGTFQQAVDRAHRIGQTSNISIYILMCKDTIDEKIYSIVKSKGALSDDIIDDKSVVDKREILNYLLS